MSQKVSIPTKKGFSLGRMKKKKKVRGVVPEIIQGGGEIVGGVSGLPNKSPRVPVGNKNTGGVRREGGQRFFLSGIGNGKTP